MDPPETTLPQPHKTCRLPKPLCHHRTVLPFLSLLPSSLRGRISSYGITRCLWPSNAITSATTLIVPLKFHCAMLFWKMHFKIVSPRSSSCGSSKINFCSHGSWRLWVNQSSHKWWNANSCGKYGRSSRSTLPFILVLESSNWRLSFAILPKDPHRYQNIYFGSRLLSIPWSSLDVWFWILSTLRWFLEVCQQSTMHLLPLWTHA